MIAIVILLSLSAACAFLVLACCVVSGRADRHAEELHRREGRCPGENHTLAPAGSTPAPATTYGKESIEDQ